ncbi:glycosyltransferase [Cupriavidus pauculus]|uniref:glycosyltransferase family 2 protein n=1 Tax=Cupriavidus pauculus TaxID=82633 RepID=UPI001EE36AC2|nr:glycosyltransferase [Cupriavidus pauculus]GJG93483.1 glycosyltransferase [Cupriavidus pauculus]
MPGKPLISVVMPAYNAQEHLAEALQSVLQQTYEYFEVILIDDGSSDHTLEIARSFDDPRIRIVENESNLGLVNTLNKALGYCRGDYIARMDADDLCVPERFQLQVDFLAEHPEVGVVGGAIRFFDNIPTPYTFHFPTAHEDIRVALMFYCPLAHPALMFRRSVYDEGKLKYTSEFPHAEDYWLWSRFTVGVRSANLPDLLLHYRLHKKQVSTSESNHQYLASRSVRGWMFSQAGIDLTQSDSELHESLILERYDPRPEYLNAVATWFQKLESANARSAFWDAGALNGLLRERFRKVLVETGVRAYRKSASHDALRYMPPPSMDPKPTVLSSAVAFKRRCRVAVKRLLGRV